MTLGVRDVRLKLDDVGAGPRCGVNESVGSPKAAIMGLTYLGDEKTSTSPSIEQHGARLTAGRCRGGSSVEDDRGK
jgi:hypothetical protein